ncbi:MAG TPA: ACT domain-containing protein [bacterium]|nr:ACT domain-containing protein [bacterium]
MIQKVKAGKEIVVTSKNKVGTLSAVSKALADRGINIVALSAQAAGGVALMNLVVDDHLRAGDALRKKGFQVQENDVVLVHVEDKPGVLRQLTQTLAAKKIDLMNIYGSTTTTYAPCLLVLSSSNNQKAIVALRK